MANLLKIFYYNRDRNHILPFVNTIDDEVD